MKLVWKKLALHDRKRIMDHIAEDNPQAALDLDELVEQKADQLIEQPELYRAGRKRGNQTPVWFGKPATEPTFAWRRQRVQFCIV